MLESVIAYLHNDFAVSAYEGDYTIKDGGMVLPFKPLDGCFIKIEGSVLNDGIYPYPLQDLQDESFSGCIKVCAVPKRLLKVVKDIEDYEKKNGISPYISESFGGYSYTKAQTENGIASWKDVFKTSLSEWRKLP